VPCTLEWLLVAPSPRRSRLAKAVAVGKEVKNIAKTAIYIQLE